MRVLSIIICVVALSCGGDDEVQMGCITGEVLGTGIRVPIQCTTKAEFEAGSNVKAGGIKTWNSYSSHQWEAVSDCQKCGL